MESVANRFLRYIKYDTKSEHGILNIPSTKGQTIFAKVLVDELKSIGMSEVSIDENSYVMATLPSNTSFDVPVIGFIAHMDTSPDFAGENINPQITEKYDGGDIMLNDNTTLSPTQFPELLKYMGQDLITTDGTTLLGADDKAGVAEIISAMQFLIHHPEIVHGKIRICFTPDEEVGRGADLFDVAKFGASYAYTIDGGEIGELEYENFNAASAVITIHGRNVHPGYAKNKMINAMNLALELASLLPANEVPELTDGYDGFFHLTSINGDVEKTTLKYIIRDFDLSNFAHRKQQIINAVEQIKIKYQGTQIDLELKDQYYNMRLKIEPEMHLVAIAQQAMIQAGVTPLIRPIRGGTDGARLSFMGLPTPNIFAGGHNFHGRYEFIPIQSMEKSVEVIVNIANILADRQMK